MSAQGFLTLRRRPLVIVAALFGFAAGAVVTHLPILTLPAARRRTR